LQANPIAAVQFARKRPETPDVKLNDLQLDRAHPVIAERLCPVLTTVDNNTLLTGYTLPNAVYETRWLLMVF
jgi:hypothetical protein